MPSACIASPITYSRSIGPTAALPSPPRANGVRPDPFRCRSRRRPCTSITSPSSSARGRAGGAPGRLRPRRGERNLIRVAAYCGTRAAETYALRWANVDLTEGRESLVVSEQWYAGELVDRPKTPAGYRQVLLPPRAAEALRSQQVAGRSSEAGLVFPAPQGGYWGSSNFNRRVWQPAREAAGLPDVRLHDLRHFYVSRIRATGLPSSVTEQLVGHSDERVHRLYTQPVAGMDPFVREHLARAFEEGRA